MSLWLCCFTELSILPKNKQTTTTKPLHLLQSLCALEELVRVVWPRVSACSSCLLLVNLRLRNCEMVHNLKLVSYWMGTEQQGFPRFHRRGAFWLRNAELFHLSCWKYLHCFWNIELHNTSAVTVCSPFCCSLANIPGAWVDGYRAGGMLSITVGRGSWFNSISVIKSTPTGSPKPTCRK